jgi:hypothetical protein
VDFEREQADALAVEQVVLHQGEGGVRRPGLLGPAGGPGRVLRLGLDAGAGAVLDPLAPQGPAHRRQPVGVLHGDDRVELELAVVHAAGEDDFVRAVRVFGADPGDVGPLAGHELGGRLFRGDVAVGVGGVLGERLQERFQGKGLFIQERKAERPSAFP